MNNCLMLVWAVTYIQDGESKVDIFVNEDAAKACEKAFLEAGLTKISVVRKAVCRRFLGLNDK